MFRSIGWSTLFDCLSIYEEKFKQSFQTPGAVLPEFQEGDAKALVAYLSVLKKVKLQVTWFKLNCVYQKHINNFVVCTFN